MPKPVGANVELLEDVRVGMPYMVPTVAEKFRKLRELVLTQSGIDFLASCADVMRAEKFKSDKPGVANRSWHKTGRAFDCDQSSPLLVIVQEDKKGQTFFRAYLRSNLGKQMDVKDFRDNIVRARLYDFTAVAESLGWQRIPAWKGWSTKGSGYNKMEFWHYQITDGLTWSQAMELTYPTPGAAAKPAVYGKNDRGFVVKRIQQALADLGLLPLDEVDSVFGAKTHAAVRAFQTKNGLIADGLVGAKTLTALGF